MKPNFVIVQYIPRKTSDC